MKSFKTSNLGALVAFCLIATILTCTVAIAADSLQLSPDNDPDSGKADLPSDGNSGNTDENNDGENKGDGDGDEVIDLPTVAPLPEFIHSITGCEITQDAAYLKPYCFILNVNAPLYGISYSYLTIEMPIENGDTRMMIFTDEPHNIGKLGALAPIRSYMYSVTHLFGATVMAHGYDGRDEISNGAFLDFKSNLGYHYTEFGELAYTNGDLIKAFSASSSSAVKTQQSVPYRFLGYHDTPIAGEGAGRIAIAYGSGNSTEFIYNSDKKSYSLCKNGAEVKDNLNGKAIEYTNVFILYTDSVTYEAEDSTQTVLDTDGCGKGVYATGGGYVEFNWSTSADGTVMFTDGNGEALTVNRGTSYLAYVKSSLRKNVEIS